MGFLQCIRSDEIVALAKSNHHAFMLLWQIAYRASRNGNKIEGLETREALVGDYGSIGLTRQQYRGACAYLVNRQIITIHTTNKGSVATLLDSTFWEINATDDNQQDNHRATIGQPSSNHQATTIKKERKKEGKKEKNKDDMFDKFWDSYPKKTGKGAARKAWI